MADDEARVRINHDLTVDPALPSGILGDVRDSQLIGPGGSERADHEVDREHDRIRLRTPPVLP
jgi:hypothetical protein